MLDRKSLLNQLNKNSVNDKDDKILMSLVCDRIEASQSKNYCIFSDFLDSTQIQKVKNVFSFMEDELLFASKIKNSQSKLVSVKSDFFEIPSKILSIKIPKGYSVSHSDILGTLMSLGIKRQKIGDIIVSDDGIFIEIKEEVFPFIKSNLTSIRNYPVEISEVPDEKNVERIQKYKEFSYTVSSLRLDCVVSSILNIAREKAKEYITSGNLKLNHIEEKTYKKIIAEGDILSLRKSGRYLFFKDDGLSKKGKNKIIIKKFI